MGDQHLVSSTWGAELIACPIWRKQAGYEVLLFWEQPQGVSLGVLVAENLGTIWRCALQPRRPTLSWAASEAVWGMGFCPSALFWWNATWSAASSSGGPNWLWIRWCESRRGPWLWPVGWRASLWKQAEMIRVVQPEEEKAPGTTYGTFQYLKGLQERDFLPRFVWIGQGRMALNWKEGRLTLDIRKQFFTVSTVRHWNSLCREAVDAPSLAVLKVRSDRALGSLV